MGLSAEVGKLCSAAALFWNLLLLYLISVWVEESARER
jgi:hypothetical protein